MSAYRDKLLGIATPRKLGQAERRDIVEDGRRVATEVEHWDGRQEATVYPDVIRHGARVHNTGKKKGEVAEIRTMNRKERRERYGDGG